MTTLLAMLQYQNDKITPVQTEETIFLADQVTAMIKGRFMSN
jgi:hypothetical protein